MLLNAAPVWSADHDLVIRNGRVINPANGLGSVRDIGICDGRIVALSREPFNGEQEVDAAGLAVAPGCIDLHCLMARPAAQAARFFDGF